MDGYHVMSLAGEGSFGRVYKGRIKSTGQVVALKFIPKLGRSDEEIRSLKQEILILKDLQHPNIVRLLDSFDTDADVVVVTEYAEGHLFQVLKDDGSLPESRVRAIAAQLVSALYYLHSHRILHRDMKPQNILLDRDGQMKLCDFGFARSMSVSTLVLTSIKGTPLYMAPELVQERPYDHTADLWALGCILYELHTGEPPFYTNSIFHLIQLIVTASVSWPRSMSDSCQSFLQGLLTKDPRQRLSWPNLLHHCFISHDVTVKPETNINNPLTEAPTADVMELKLQQMNAARSGGGRLRALRAEGARVRPGGGDAGETVVKIIKPSVSSPDSVSEASIMSVMTVDSLEAQSRGRISLDYETEFIKHHVCATRRSTSQQVRGEHQEQHEGLTCSSDVLHKLKANVLLFRRQLSSGRLEVAEDFARTPQVLTHLIQTSKGEAWKNLCREMELPDLLLDLLHDCVESPGFTERPWSTRVLSELMLGILGFCEQERLSVCDRRRERSCRIFCRILHHSDSTALAPLVASVLVLLSGPGADVQVTPEDLVSLINTCSLHSCQMLPGHSLTDGLLTLLVQSLAQKSLSVLEPLKLLALWKTLASFLESPNTQDFISGNGLFSFLSASLTVLSRDPDVCVLLFSDGEARCVRTLRDLLDSDRLQQVVDFGSPRLDQGLSRSSFVELSSTLLMFPFALDVPSTSMTRILQLYGSCDVINALLQVVWTLPPPLLWLPLSLTSRLLLCDPDPSVSCLTRDPSSWFCAEVGFSSLLSGCLEQSEESTCELLTLLFLLLHFCPAAPLQPPLESRDLRAALSHGSGPVRVAACRLLGQLAVTRRPRPPAPEVFRALLERLRDPFVAARRSAGLAVKKWLKTAAASPEEGGASQDGEWRAWLEEARRTPAALAALISDPDTRRYARDTLTHIVSDDFAAAMILKENLHPVILKENLHPVILKENLHL